MYLAHKVKSGFTPVFQNDLCAKSFEQRFESSKGEFIMDKRISKDEYYLSIAAAVARRSTCLRRQYGAVIIKNDEIIYTGYNGAARGEPNCCDTGECWREANNIPHGEQYEKCVAVHAEQNAIISAARHEMLGSVLYLAGFDSNGELAAPAPCVICSRLIKNAGIAEVVSRGANGEPVRTQYNRYN